MHRKESDSTAAERADATDELDDPSVSVASLREAARAADPAVRVAAVERLAGADSTEADSLLADAVLDPDREVVLAAIRAVGRLELASARSALAVVVERESDPDVRAAAVEALGRIGGEDAIPPLLTALEVGPVELACAALERIEGVSREGTTVRLLDHLAAAIDAGEDGTADSLARLLRRVDSESAIRLVQDRQRADCELVERIGELGHGRSEAPP